MSLRVDRTSHAATPFGDRTPAQVVKLVDAGDSKSPAARRAGSIPALGTTRSRSRKAFPVVWRNSGVAARRLHQISLPNRGFHSPNGCSSAQAVEEDPTFQRLKGCVRMNFSPPSFAAYRVLITVAQGRVINASLPPPRHSEPTRHPRLSDVRSSTKRSNKSILLTTVTPVIAIILKSVQRIPRDYAGTAHARYSKPTMTDHVSKEKRSLIMQSVPRTGSTAEVCVRKVVWRLGYRYRLNDKHLPGSPDIVLTRIKKAIFVHGCFWHGHINCPKGRLPKSNQSYWAAKVDSNRARDARAIDLLEAQGWKCLVVWQCECKNAATLTEKLDSFLSSK